MKRTAFSYIRFSSPEQAKGDSYRRQLSRTEEFCQKHDLLLSETRFEDLGVSSWTGKNIERGALGDFREAVKASKIPKGSVLIVENFDRFSRLKPRVAYNKLAEIIEQGVDVVTLEDGKFHTPQTLDDFATLVSSLAIMQRSNEESTRKSSLVGVAWANKRKETSEGKRILTKSCPLWLRAKQDGTGFEPIPERAKVIRRIFGLIKQGLGKREIARTFDMEGIKPWSKAKTWRESYVLETIKSRTPLGELQPSHKRKPIGQPIKGYYPAIVDEATWAAVQPQREKPTAGPRTGCSAAFSTMGIIRSTPCSSSCRTNDATSVICKVITHGLIHSSSSCTRQRRKSALPPVSDRCRQSSGDTRILNSTFCNIFRTLIFTPSCRKNRATRLRGWNI